MRACVHRVSIYWRYIVNASNGNRKSCGKWGGMRSMIPFIRRRSMGRTIYGQLYTGAGVTLVFTDPGGDKSRPHTPPPSRAEFESRIPKLYLIETSSCRLLSGIRYSIKLRDARSFRPIQPVHPFRTPPLRNSAKDWHSMAEEGGCRCNGWDQVCELEVCVLEILILVLLLCKFVKILFSFLYLTYLELDKMRLTSFDKLVSDKFLFVTYNLASLDLER